MPSPCLRERQRPAKLVFKRPYLASVLRHEYDPEDIGRILPSLSAHGILQSHDSSQYVPHHPALLSPRIFTGKVATNRSSSSSVKPPRIPSSTTTSDRHPLAVSVRWHVELSNLRL